MSHISHFKKLHCRKVLHVFLRKVSKKTKLSAKNYLSIRSRMRNKKVHISFTFKVRHNFYKAITFGQNVEEKPKSNLLQYHSDVLYRLKLLILLLYNYFILDLL